MTPLKKGRAKEIRGSNLLASSGVKVSIKINLNGKKLYVSSE
jgi:hypothetical protein